MLALFNIIQYSFHISTKLYHLFEFVEKDISSSE